MALTQLYRLEETIEGNRTTLELERASRYAGHIDFLPDSPTILPSAESFKEAVEKRGFKFSHQKGAHWVYNHKNRPVDATLDTGAENPFLGFDFYNYKRPAMAQRTLMWMAAVFNEISPAQIAEGNLENAIKSMQKGR